jgi:hypothetical protein
MIIYHFWFELKEGRDHDGSLAFIDKFLKGKKDEGKLSNYGLFKNQSSKDTRLLKYHAMMEFRDEKQFESSFSEIRGIGINKEQHGEIVQMVKDFHVEFFEDIHADK